MTEKEARQLAASMTAQCPGLRTRVHFALEEATWVVWVYSARGEHVCTLRAPIALSAPGAAGTGAATGCAAS